MSKKLYFRTNTNKTNKSLHNNPKYNETNSKTKLSMMSSLTDTKLEGKSSEEWGSSDESDSGNNSGNSGTDSGEDDDDEKEKVKEKEKNNDVKLLRDKLVYN